MPWRPDQSYNQLPPLPPAKEATETLRYRTALYEGFLQLQRKPLGTSTSIEICSTQKGVDMDVRKVPGTIIGNQTEDHVRQQLPKIYSHELVQTIFEQPYCRISNLVDKGIAQRQSASNYLKQLVEIGVLQEKTAGNEKLFLNPRLLRLMTNNHIVQNWTTKLQYPPIN